MQRDVRGRLKPDRTIVVRLMCSHAAHVCGAGIGFDLFDGNKSNVLV